MFTIISQNNLKNVSFYAIVKNVKKLNHRIVKTFETLILNASDSVLMNTFNKLRLYKSKRIQ